MKAELYLDLTIRSMTEYKTVEGHEIKVGEYYETRQGSKAQVIVFKSNITNDYPVVAEMIDGSVNELSINGAWIIGENDPGDLMRPWVDKEKKKVYKLSDMWVIWFRNEGFVHEPIEKSKLYECKCEALNFVNLNDDSSIFPIAITKADATEFYEGEGLEGIK